MQLASEEFRRFASQYEFIHTTSSPHYSQSIEQTERYMQTVKNIKKQRPLPGNAGL